MSRRRAIEAQVHNLADIRDILNAMKNLARMELSRLRRFLDAQRKMVASIEAAALDFRYFHPNLFVANAPRCDVYVLAGSERGFCGDFNEALLNALRDQVVIRKPVQIIALGSRLHSKIADEFPMATLLAGADVSDEIEAVLTQLIDTLAAAHRREAPGSVLEVTAFHHPMQATEVQVSRLQPFSEPVDRAPYAQPPLLYTPPERFVDGLLEVYLFAKLHELLYSSLAAENQTRMDHMESAVQRIDRKTEELLRKRNALRQEEITEEIEVIMLSV